MAASFCKQANPLISKSNVMNHPAILSTPIDSIDAFRVSVPLTQPIYAIGSLITAREFIFARVTAGGQTGTGFGLTRGASIETVVDRQIAPLLKNRTIGDIRAIWQSARDTTRMVGDTGLFARALAVVDIALWDVMTRVLGVPLWRLLGGRQQDVPCAAIMGYYRQGDQLSVLRAEAEALVKAGYTRFKMPFGADKALDIQRVAALREIAGDKAVIGLDANAVFDTPKQAATAWRSVERFAPAFLEDPFPGVEWQQAMEMSRSSDIPIAFGEVLSSPDAVQQLSAGIDILRPDATHQLGVTGYIQGVGRALEHRTPIFPHYFPDIHAPLLGALGGWMTEESPFEADTVGFWQMRATQPVITNGMWRLTDAPGFGIDWDEERLTRFRVKTKT